MTSQPAAPICEVEVEFLARALIAQHGPNAATAASGHLDELTTLGNLYKRDTWAAVVQEIHNRLGGQDATAAAA